MDHDRLDFQIMYRRLEGDQKITQIHDLRIVSIVSTTDTRSSSGVADRL